MKAKKGFLGLASVPSLVITLVVIAIMLGIGSNILTNIQTGQTTGTYAYNASQNGLVGIDKIAGWQSTWAIVLASAVVIGIVMVYMSFGNRE